MPSILESKFQQKKTEETRIAEKVEKQPISATTDERSMIDQLVRDISNQYKNELADVTLDRNVLDKEIEKTIIETVEKMDISYEKKRRVEKLAIMNIIGLGPIQPLLANKNITEIVVQRYDNICVEMNGLVSKVNVAFSDEDNLKNVINRILQPISRQINLSTPIVDARLRDGSRVCATIPPVSPHGATLTIRKFQNEKMTPDEYIRLKSISEQGMEFLKACVKSKLSMFVSGGTGTGKTTMLNALSSFLNNNELIITIEDTLELQLKQSNVRSLETRNSTSEAIQPIDMSALVKASLRMRPDTIICGEVRDQAVIQFLNAASTGHEGSMCTAHANSPENLVNVRIPIMMSMDKDTSFSEQSRAMQIAEAVQMIVQLKRLRSGRRVVSRITAINGVNDSGYVNLNDVFIYDEVKDELECTYQLPEYILSTMQTRTPEAVEGFTAIPNRGFV